MSRRNLTIGISAFVLLVGLSSTVVAQETPSHAEDARSAGAQPGRRRVLVVDDNADAATGMAKRADRAALYERRAVATASLLLP